MFAIKKLTTNKNFSAEKKARKVENKVKKKKKEYHINFIIELNGPSGTLCQTPWDTRRDATSLFLSGFVCYFCVCLWGSLRVNVCVCVCVCACSFLCIFVFK